MSGWDIDFDRLTADCIGEEIRRCKHLMGFEAAENALKALKSMLEKALFDAEWWRNKCDERASHYEYMQEQYRDNPDDFSDDHAYEVNSVSPQVYREYSAELKSGMDKLRAAIDSVGKMLVSIEKAKGDAVKESTAVAEKIYYAIELMDKYLQVGF